MIVASGDSRVLLASKHVIVLRIKSKVLARAHHLSHSMHLKQQDRRAHGSAEEAHPKVQTETSDRSLSRHVSHPRKMGPVKVSKLVLLLSAGAAGFAGRALGLTVSVCGKYAWKIVLRSFFGTAGIHCTL